MKYFLTALSIFSLALTLSAEKNPTPTNADYPVNMSGFLLKSKVFQLNNIDKGKSQTKTVEVFNSTKALITPTIEKLPAYISVTITPASLKPNETGKISITFNSSNCLQWGSINDELYISLNGKTEKSDVYKVVVVANVVENFAGMTMDQKRNAPILELETNTINLGSVRMGDKRLVKIKLTNKGINTLEIRRVINNNSEIIPRQSKLTLKSGKSSQILLDLLSTGLPVGDYKKSITLQTNDPDNRFVILILAWKVIK